MTQALYTIPPAATPVRDTLVKDGKTPPSLGVPPEKNLAVFLRRRAEDVNFKDRVFLEALNESSEETPPARQTFTFAEFDRITNRFANLLTSLGFAQGKSIGFIGENIAEMHITYIGTGKVGSLCAPLNPRDSVEKWRLTFQDCQVAAVVVEEQFFNQKFFDLVKDLTSLKEIFVVARERIPDHPELPCPVILFSDALKQQAETFDPPESLGWSEPYLLVYTSGTTGNPKGVVISLETIWRCANSINEHFGLGPDDHTFAQLSGFHVNHIVVSFWGALAGGYRCVMTNRFRPERYFQHLQADGITVSSVVPTNLAYAIKTELETGKISADPQFHQAFRGFFIEHLSKYVSAEKITLVWKEALEKCGDVIDQIKFFDTLRGLLETYTKGVKDFPEIYNTIYSMAFARTFQPFFQKSYGLAPQKLRIICGAGDLALELAIQFSRLTGLQITQGWGMSEGTCYNSMSFPNQSWLLYWLTLGSIGPEMSTTNMSIIATDGELKAQLSANHLVLLTPHDMAQQNKVGMIAMRGAVTSMGYYRNDKANEETFVDGWLLTGDAGNALMLADAPNFKNFVRDCRTLSFGQILLKYPQIEERYHSLLKKIKETGNRTALFQVLCKEHPLLATRPFYFIKGRIKDIIITKGQNIPCDEIEAAALNQAGVFEAVAVGIGDVEDGEVPGLVITRHPQSTVSAAELLEFCRDRKVLPRLQWPVGIAIVEALPKTPTGKYQRVRAREVFSDQLQAPLKTRQFGIAVSEFALAKDYDPARRPKAI